MRNANDEYLSDDELLDSLLSVKPTNPETLEWKPLLFFLKNTLRLRMNITRQNASQRVLDSYLTYDVPKTDFPEVVGLLRVLKDACENCGLEYQVTKGSYKLIRTAVSYREPYKFRLPFKHAKLSMVIPPGEIHWIMNNVKKERKSGSPEFEMFLESLLNETKRWLGRGNR